MLIKPEPLAHWIDNFFGYGSWHARFWFVAYEDSGGETPEEVAEKINYFYDVHNQAQEGELSDIRQFFRHLTIPWDGPKANMFSNRFDYRFGEQAAPNTVWRNLIAFEHGYRGEPVPDALAYQRDHLAAPNERNEALVRLFPLPASNHHAWYYAWLDLPDMPFLKSRRDYEEHVYPGRMQRLLNYIKTYKPEVVLMYGMNNINTLKRSVLEGFSGASFRMVKAQKQYTPQYHRADLDGTVLLITTQFPALHHGRVETGFDWEAFGKRVASE